MEVLLGKSSVNGPFSIAMLNYQRVSVHIRPIPWPPGHPLAKNCVEISGLLGLWNWHFNRPGRRAFSKEGTGSDWDRAGCLPLYDLYVLASFVGQL